MYYIYDLDQSFTVVNVSYKTVAKMFIKTYSLFYDSAHAHKAV